MSTHITTSTKPIYYITNENNIVCENNSNISLITKLHLPDYPLELRVITIHNVSSSSIYVTSDTGSLIYSHLHAPNGTNELRLNSLKNIRLTYIISQFTNTRYWMSELF